jgi:uncharacterized membrane protein
MNKGRLEAFSDGVLAIIITIMVLELKVPEEGDFAALLPLAPKFLSYVLSFVYIGIYWNNHHHLWQAVKKVSGAVLLANLHLLFWLSLVPFASGWMGENNFSQTPVLLYGIILTMAALAYYLLTVALLANHEKDSPLAIAIGKDTKGKLSLVLYIAAIGLSFINSLIALAIYALVAVIWFLPDRRIENRLKN